jgi:hypothetical protein
MNHSRILNPKISTRGTVAIILLFVDISTSKKNVEDLKKLKECCTA